MAGGSRAKNGTEENREQGTGNREWGMGNGEWGMGNGEWGMEQQADNSKKREDERFKI